MTTKAQARASMKYHKANIKRVPLDVQISEYEKIKDAAAAVGVPVNTFIKQAIRQYMEH